MKQLLKQITINTSAKDDQARTQRDITFNWSAKVSITNTFEVVDIDHIIVTAFDSTGEEVELDCEESAIIIDYVRRQAEIQAIEKASVSSFEDDQEEY